MNNTVEFIDNYAIIKDITHFGLKETLDNGSTFRWSALEANRFLGIVHNKVIQVARQGNDIIIHNISQAEYENYFKYYFDMETDYSSIYEILKEDETLDKLIPSNCPIRLVKQDFIESFISAYISQNNNISRIKGIIYKLSVAFGNPIKYFDKTFYSFPSLEILHTATEQQFQSLGLGYRAKGLKLAIARLIEYEKLYGDLDKFTSKMCYADLYYWLIDFKGIGDKVANFIIAMNGQCKDYMSSFTIDTWIKKAIPDLFQIETSDTSRMEELKCNVFKNFNTIAQQNIFYYYRNR